MRTSVLLLLLSVPSPSSAQLPTSDSLAVRLGIAWQPLTRPSCVVLPDTAATARELTLLWPPANQVGGPKMIVVQTAVGERIEDCGLPEGIGHRSYRLGVKLDTYVPYLAILGKVGHATSKTQYVAINVLADDSPESVKACMSMEGVHFTIWAGLPMKSRLLYHTYAPLGYDVEPNCSEAETADPSR